MRCTHILMNLPNESSCYLLRYMTASYSVGIMNSKVLKYLLVPRKHFNTTSLPPMRGTHGFVSAHASPLSLGSLLFTPRACRVTEWLGPSHPQNPIPKWSLERSGWGTNCACHVCIMLSQGYICVCKCDVWCVGSRILKSGLQIYCCKRNPL